MPARTRPVKESTVKEHVKRLLKKHSAYYFMPVQSGYGASALDFYGCHKGRFFAVETKRPGKHLTPRQELLRLEIEQAGGVAFVVGERETWPNKEFRFTGLEALEGWLLLGI